MAALATGNPTLLDQAKATNPDGTVGDVVEILNQTNEVLDDLTSMEGNMVDGHRSNVRVYLPAPTWRKFNQGVLPNKGGLAQVKDSTGMLEAYGEIDKDLAMLNGNTASFRLLEDSAHIEGMNQEVAQTLFYGNEGLAPEEFTGFAPRFNALSGAPNSENIITGGGSGSDNGSIWLIVWSPQTVFTVFPKGTTAGLKTNDLGEDTKVESTGAMYQVLRSHYQWKLGLVVRDWRYVVRIPNIDKSLLLPDASGTSANLPRLMFRAMRRIPSFAAGRAAFYCSRDMATMLGEQVAQLTTNSTLSSDMVGGKFVERFKGIPVRRVDALAADEAVVA